MTEINIKHHLVNKHWDLSNQILYDLCSNHFYHKNDDAILAKTFIIGRTYAVALERRKNKVASDISDDFYTTDVLNAFKNYDIDKDLSELSSIILSEDSILAILQTHYKLQVQLRKITEMEKRSFCSKYLHFHLPNLFYIYDSRAETAIRNFEKKVDKNLTQYLNHQDIDKTYATFFLKCFALKQKLDRENELNVTPRQIDNLLIEIANKPRNSHKT